MMFEKFMAKSCAQKQKIVFKIKGRENNLICGKLLSL